MVTDPQVYYRGNTNLKPKGVSIEWTDELISEYMKCAADPIYFAENYVKVVHPDRGLELIKLYDYQKRIIKSYLNGRFTVVNTSRQAGKTTTATIIILHYILFNEYKTVALTANKGDSAREILSRIQIGFENLPKWLQQGVVEWNKGSVYLENGCKVFAGATSSSSIRGQTVQLLYIDETAFVENWDEFFSSVFPTITAGKDTKVLLTSTPNGLNHFYKIFEGAKKNKNGYKFIEVPWWEVPGRDEQWKKETLEGMNFNMQKFEQEFCCEFQGSSGTLIDGATLKLLEHKEPILDKDGLKLYKQPQLDHIYACICDVSRGKGLDYSAFHIIDVTEMPYEQVCTFRDNMVTPLDYAEIIFRTSKSYNDAMILVETNDIGGQVVDSLHEDFMAENIIYTESAGRAGKRISPLFGGAKARERGIRTTKSVKGLGCSMAKLLIEQFQLKINDWNTIQELSTFSKKGPSYEAEPGCNDDMVMGLVLFSWMTDQAYFKELTDINTLQHLRDNNEEKMMETLMPFGFYDSGHDDDLNLDIKDSWQQETISPELYTW